MRCVMDPYSSLFSLKDAVKTLKNRLAQSQKSNAALETEVRDMQQKRDDLKQATADLARVKGEMFVIIAERDSASHNMQSLQGILNQKNQLLEEALSNIKVLQDDKAKMNTVMSTHERELVAAQARIADLVSQVEQVHAQKSRSEMLLSEVQDRYAELAKQNEGLTKQVAKAHGMILVE